MSVDVPLPPGSWAILPEGGRPTGPPTGGSKYPFVDPEPTLRGIVADFWLAHSDPGVVPPLSVTRLSGLDRAVNGGVVVGPDVASTHAVDVAVADGRGLVIFDSTTAPYYYAVAYGPRLAIHEWRTADATCRLAQHTAVASAADAALLPRTITPARGALDARTSLVLPPRVRSLGTDPAAPGGVTLVAGYNVALTPGAGPSVTIAAVAGAGAGRAPGCGGGEADALRTINGQGPDPRTGNLALDTSGCYYFRRVWIHPDDAAPGVLVRLDGTLKVGNDCKPCCACADYADVQAGVLAGWAGYEAIAADVGRMVDRYAAMVARWDAARACREARAVKLNAMAYNADVDVVVTLVNPSDACAYAVILVATIDPAPFVPMTVDPQASYRIDEGGGSVPVAPTFAAPSPGTPGTVAVAWPFLPPGITVGFRFRLVLAGTGTFTTLSVSAAATAGGAPLGVAATKVLTR